MSAAAPLTALGILVTRPVDQAARLTARLTELGARPLQFPALAIVGPAQPEALRAQLAGINRYDWAIFVSPTAVQFGLAAVPAVAEAAQRINAAAVGHGTAAALRAAGCQNVLVASAGADSEQLLSLPEFAHLAGKRVLIFRGEGGRELIAETLRARGAEVDYAECYRRTCPQIDPISLRQALAQHQLHAITVFSRETLDNLLQLLGAEAAETARALPLFVPHVRIAQHAQARQFSHVIATEPGEDGVLARLVEYFRHD